MALLLALMKLCPNLLRELPSKMLYPSKIPNLRFVEVYTQKNKNTFAPYSYGLKV